MSSYVLKLTLLIALTTSTGCSMLADKALDLVGGPSSGLDVDANVGKAEAEGDQSVSQNANTALTGQVNETSNETFEGPVGQVVNEAGLEVHELLLLVLLAGWAIPSPREMLLGVAHSIRDTWLALRGRRTTERGRYVDPAPTPRHDQPPPV